MKTLTGLLAVAFAWSSQARSPEKAVSDLEQQWAEAQKVGQVDIVALMLADTFINTDAGGETYGKSKLLANLKGGKWEVNGISDVQVRIYGDAAVAAGSWKGKGVDGDGSSLHAGRLHAGPRITPVTS